MALLAPPDHADDYFDVLSLSQPGADPIALKAELAEADARLAEHFYQWQNISRLVRTRAWVVEQFILYFWQQAFDPNDAVTLVAVGGFGRGDLQPHSDVDLLILYNDHLPQQAVSEFIQNLWDLGLDIGHAVRTVDESVALASEDVTVATNIMEARFMRGQDVLFSDMVLGCRDDSIWSGKDFFQAKYQEQFQRHQKWGGTAYNLEPNIKEGQGGLRDIQMVTWVAQRHYHVSSMHGLVDVGFLAPDEYIRLQKGQRKLWKIRYALHLLAGRKEDRLLFEYQKPLAKIFGHVDDDDGLAVEKFMQAHYRNAMQLELLNIRLLQLFKENILLGGEAAKTTTLNEDFLIINDYLEAKDSRLFFDKPSAMMDVFLLCQSHKEIKGIRANTLRYLSQSLEVIDDDFRNDPVIKDKFLAIFKHHDLVFTQLSMMNALGILGLYLPVFGQIVGRMQYDLFHMYTVDQHSLFVLRNIRRIIRTDDKHPLAHQVASEFDRPYVLCLAGFFHDIAKGRGGDHAELGAVDAQAFAQTFGINEADGELLSWLVKYHLIMSVVAQKQDISDSHVVDKFAALVGDQRHLDALYVLTVADITGTDPKLWNAYKDSLLSELYQRTLQHLKQVQPQDPIAHTQNMAMQGLQPDEVKSIKDLWNHFPRRFFKENSPEQVVKISRAVLDNQGGNTVFFTEKHPDGFEFFIYGQEHKGLFHHVAKLLTAYPVNIVNARILSSQKQSVMDSFHCLGAYDDAMLTNLQSDLMLMLETQQTPPKIVSRRTGINAKYFDLVTEIQCVQGDEKYWTKMEIKCNDRHGLLATITGVFLSHEIDVEGAKISTFGHQVEDVFWLSQDGLALSGDVKKGVIESLMLALSEE